MRDILLIEHFKRAIREDLVSSPNVASISGVTAK